MTVAGGVDHRRYARQRLAALTYIELGKENGGIVLNLGEGGAAFAVASPLLDTAIPELRFRLPGSAEWIHTSAEVAWMGPSRKEGGISFLDLAEADRARIREWISTPEPAPPPVAPSFRPLDRPHFDVPGPELDAEPELPSASINKVSEAATAEPPAKELPVAAPPASPPAATLSPKATPAMTPTVWTKDAAKRSANEPWIRVELRLNRWLATAFVILFVAALSFVAGMLAQRDSWADRLAAFLKQTGSASDGLQPASGNTAGGDSSSPSSPQSNLPASSAEGAALPAASTRPPSASGSTASPSPKGTVEVSTDLHPSVRVSSGGPIAEPGSPLHLGELTYRIEPIYPSEAVRLGIQGVVQMHILISADGSVMDMVLVTGSRLLASAVRDAVMNWHYQPTLLGSEAVETESDVIVKFRLATPAPQQ